MLKIKATPFLLALIGILFFSAKSVLVKLAYTYNIDFLSLLVFRMAFSLPFYIAIILYKQKDRRISVTKRDYLWLLLFAIIGNYLAMYCDFKGLSFIKASLERIILFTYPTLVLVISWIVFKKTITKIQIIAIIISYLGIVVAFWDDLSLSGESVLIGAGLIFLSALTYAIYLVGSGWLLPKFGTIKFTSYAMIISAISVFVHYSITHEINLLNYNRNLYIIAFCMAFFCTVIPSLLVSEAIKGMGASDFSILGSLGPVTTIILASLFLGEQISFLQLIGTFIVIIGVIMIKKKVKNPNEF